MAAKKSRQPNHEDESLDAGASKDAESQSASTYTPDRIKKLAAVLHGVAAEFEGIHKSMSSEGIKHVVVRDKMVKRSVLHINNFADQIRRALREMRGLDF
jgi:hypothetical protein